MVFNAGQDAALVQRANLNIAAAVVAKHGSGASDSLIGHAIDQVRASHSVSELAGSGGMAMVVGAVETFLARNSEADRPRNLYGAETARAVQAAGIGQHGGHGEGTALGRYGSLLAGRGGRDPGGDSDGGASGGSSYAVSGTGSEPAGAPFWGSAKGMLLTRSYANDNGMGWAPSDLMQMGRPALQALKESGLKGDGYKALRDPSGLHFDNSSILAGASYMRRKHLNHNEAAKAGAAVYAHPSMTSADKKDWKKVIDRKNYSDGPEGDKAYADAIHQAATRGKEKHREMTPEFNRAMRAYGADKGVGLDAKAAVKKNEAGAKRDEAATKQKTIVADSKDTKADVKYLKANTKVAESKTAQKRQDATKSKLLGMYN